MKKTVSVILSLLMLLSFAACGKEAEKTNPQKTEAIYENTTYSKPEKTPLANGSLTPEISWELFDDGSLYVEGTGAMPDWAKIKDLAWRDRIHHIKSVYIGDGITRIGNYAFSYCQNLSSVYISETVTSIGNSAFIRCENLRAVRIPDSVTEIEAFAFAHCLSLESVNIPESVTLLGDTAFGGCSKIGEISLHKNITYVGEYCFAGWGENQIINIACDESYIKDNWHENWDINCSASKHISN